MPKCEKANKENDGQTDSTTDLPEVNLTFISVNDTLQVHAKIASKEGKG
jgi:hypothetical protein